MAPEQTKKITSPIEKKQCKQTWQQHAKEISKAWQKAAESIIETGRLLIVAKDDLNFGTWLTMVKANCPLEKTPHNG